MQIAFHVRGAIFIDVISWPVKSNRRILTGRGLPSSGYVVQIKCISATAFVCKYLEIPAEEYCLIIRSFYIQIFTLKFNVFVIYDESKAVPQRPSHDKVSQKQVAN